MKLTAEQYALAKDAGIRAANHELAMPEQILYTTLTFPHAYDFRHHRKTRKVLECAMYDYEQNND